MLFVTLLGWVLLLIAMGGNPSLLLEGTAVPCMYLLYVMGVLALAGALLIVIHGVRSWMAPRRGGWAVLGETLLGVLRRLSHLADPRLRDGQFQRQVLNTCLRSSPRPIG